LGFRKDIAEGGKGAKEARAKEQDLLRQYKELGGRPTPTAIIQAANKVVSNAKASPSTAGKSNAPPIKAIVGKKN